MYASSLVQNPGKNPIISLVKSATSQTSQQSEQTQETSHNLFGNISAEEMTKLRKAIYYKIDGIVQSLQEIACYDLGMRCFSLKDTSENKEMRAKFMEAEKLALGGESVKNLSYKALSQELKAHVKAFLFMTGNDYYYEVYEHLGGIFQVNMPSYGLYNQAAFCEEEMPQFNRDCSYLLLSLYEKIIDPALKDEAFLLKLAKNYMSFLKGVKADLFDTGMTQEITLVTGEGTIEFLIDEIEEIEEDPVTSMGHEKLITSSLAKLHQLYQLLEVTKKETKIDQEKLLKFRCDADEHFAELSSRRLVSEEENTFYHAIITERIKECHKNRDHEIKSLEVVRVEKKNASEDETTLEKWSVEDRVQYLEATVKEQSNEIKENRTMIKALQEELAKLKDLFFSKTLKTGIV